MKITTNIPSAVIGDVHGCAEELRELVEVLQETRPGIRIVLTGDLLTKGPDPCGVVRSIRDFRQAGVDLNSVCGNQDLRAFAMLKKLAEVSSAEEILEILRDFYHLGRLEFVHSGMIRCIFQQNTQMSWAALQTTVESST